MKVIYEEVDDTLHIHLTDKVAIESGKEQDGFVLSYDKEGDLVSIDVLNFSKKVKDPEAIVKSFKL